MSVSEALVGSHALHDKVVHPTSMSVSEAHNQIQALGHTVAHPNQHALAHHALHHALTRM